MVGFEHQHRTRRQNDLGAPAIHYHRRPAMDAAGVEMRAAAKYSVVNNADASADFDWIAVELVDFSSNGKSHALANTCLNCMAYGLRVRDITDHCSPGV